jgi:5-methylcytosine-specific restriction protein A
MHLWQKQHRIKLDSEEYPILRKLVLERDGWRCQECGSARNLQVHHLRPRSQLGGDRMQNLITLCACCHGLCHRR